MVSKSITYHLIYKDKYLVNFNYLGTYLFKDSVFPKIVLDVNYR